MEALKFILMILTIIAINLWQMQAKRKELKGHFNVNKWFRENAITLLFSIIVGIIWILADKDTAALLSDKLHLTQTFYQLNAVVGGALGYFILNDLRKLKHFLKK